jgi:hypothetical protein
LKLPATGLSGCGGGSRAVEESRRRIQCNQSLTVAVLTPRQWTRNRRGRGREARRGAVWCLSARSTSDALVRPLELRHQLPMRMLGFRDLTTYGPPGSARTTVSRTTNIAPMRPPPICARSNGKADPLRTFKSDVTALVCSLCHLARTEVPQPRLIGLLMLPQFPRLTAKAVAHSECPEEDAGQDQHEGYKWCAHCSCPLLERLYPTDAAVGASPGPLWCVHSAGSPSEALMGFLPLRHHPMAAADIWVISLKTLNLAPPGHAGRKS